MDYFRSPSSSFVADFLVVSVIVFRFLLIFFISSVSMVSVTFVALVLLENSILSWWRIRPTSISIVVEVSQLVLGVVIIILDELSIFLIFSIVFVISAPWRTMWTIKWLRLHALNTTIIVVSLLLRLPTSTSSFLAILHLWMSDFVRFLRSLQGCLIAPLLFYNTLLFIKVLLSLLSINSISFFLKLGSLCDFIEFFLLSFFFVLFIVYQLFLRNLQHVLDYANLFFAYFLHIFELGNESVVMFLHLDVDGSLIAELRLVLFHDPVEKSNGLLEEDDSFFGL